MILLRAYGQEGYGITSGRMLDTFDRTEHVSQGQQQKGNGAATVAAIPGMSHPSMVVTRQMPRPLHLPGIHGGPTHDAITAVSSSTNLTIPHAVIVRTEMKGRSPALTELVMLAVLINKTQSDLTGRGVFSLAVRRRDRDEVSPSKETVIPALVFDNR
ncbi:hypothetical protein KIPB_008722 [Kipferlia bialata]|uniref:Uncharacterized protein n=1 Tax=Kipferlia bialata TaxID=797122 RepID=A0A391NNF2_9EUKA|nr:hypothetical protein KIPB_008722 [Kipferlia bialata]|eukprot:g8722.t1